jgi:hypothetical protein
MIASSDVPLFGADGKIFSEYKLCDLSEFSSSILEIFSETISIEIFIILQPL